MCSVTEAGFSSEEVLALRFPLHRACRDGDINALCLLLEHATGSDLSAEDSFYGWTPLHWAAHFGKLECIMKLVQTGAAVNTITTRFAQTPAHIAAFGGHQECLLWLIKAGANINRQDYVAETPIHKAARSGSLDCVNVLLLHGAEINLKSSSGLSAAELAYNQGFQECAQFLLNAQNHRLSGSFINGVQNGGHQNMLFTSPVGVIASRKRTLGDGDHNGVKKARTDACHFEVLMAKMNGRLEEPVENMSVETDSPNISDVVCSNYTWTNGMDVSEQLGITPSAQINGTAINRNLSSITNESFSNGIDFCNGMSEPNVSSPESKNMSGGLHHNGSPSSCVTLKPLWMPSSSDGDNYDEAWHYGHYHGFGDTAECIPELNSVIEHSSSVKIEQKYDSAVYNAMHLFHGS
ncbi:ankyrin repeat domain-containing protein 10 [Protopterus annectens]|uniref:ankyrin repeat domain-containing protein 10 n=1 Tax=Protopterus annectens TaxID=7888 RepID=UPI001CF9EB56|nr:ankyrin repeat domain-containing protein 10 [Protopterus annectens]